MLASNFRLIARKEFLDLMRDRRTVLLILILPIILYPLFGFSGYLFALSLLGKETRVGIIGAEHLPTEGEPWPALLHNNGSEFADGLDVSDAAATGRFEVRKLSTTAAEALRTKEVDAVITINPGFSDRLRSDSPERPVILLEFREGDEKAKLAAKRAADVLSRWEDRLREVRFAAAGLPAEFHRVVSIVDTLADKPKEKRAADELRDTFGRVFPLILIMWLLAGAIQPAVDMTAGEKERGTMETLLISPASRAEIVFGKFVAVTIFAFLSVLWNVIWLTSAAYAMEIILAFPVLNLPGVVGCLMIGLPQAMLFSAVCLALGVFAKSTKEGQYYLMPLILITMPFAFYSMLPGSELTFGNFWIPVTGPMLLQSRLLSVSAEPVPWIYYLLVFGSSFAWVGLALWLAVRQFSRESVLFREASQSKPSLASLFRRNQA